MITTTLFSLCFQLLCMQPSADSNITSLRGYADVVVYENGYVAVGEDGQLHQLSAQGSLQKKFSVPDLSLVTAVSSSKGVMAASTSGRIIHLGSDGTLKRIDALEGKAIGCLAWFNALLLVGTTDGKLYCGSEDIDFQEINLSLKGIITALSANSDRCYGVTNRGEIISTQNGKTWKVFDFDKEYKGYYKSVQFTAVLVSEKGIAVAGINEEGHPVFYHSAKGQVWIETPLSYSNHEGAMHSLEATPNDIYFDSENQTYYLACTEGYLMILPSCNQCHQLIKLPTTSLRAVSGNSQSILVAGTNAFLQSFTPITFP